jgi:hypothetical protein
MTAEPVISRHAIERFMERTGCKSETRARNRLVNLAANARPIKNGRHYARGFVLVIEGETVVTVYRPTELFSQAEVHALMKRP